MRDRPAGHARGDRRLAAIRPRRLAASRAGCGPVEASRRPRAAEGGTRLGCGGRTSATRRPMRAAIAAHPRRAGGRFARLATVIAGALPVVEQREVAGMITFETEQTIERRHGVWAYAADIARHPEWMGVIDAAVLRGVGPGVGSRGRSAWPSGRSSGTWNSRSPRRPGRRIVWRSISGAPFELEVSLDSLPPGQLDPGDIRGEASASTAVATARAGDRGGGQGRPERSAAPQGESRRLRRSTRRARRATTAAHRRCGDP